MNVTKKAVQGKYPRIINLGYCQAPDLLGYQTRIGYTAGVNGWNADIYELYGVAIVTGYRPFGNIEPAWELVQAYEEKARAIQNNTRISHTACKSRINTLLGQFIAEVINKEVQQ